jgi:hypothetical protein
MLRARAGAFERLGQNMRTSVHLDRGRDLRVGYDKSTSCDSMRALGYSMHTCA